MKNKIVIQRGVDYPGAGGMSFTGGLGISDFEALVLYWDGIVNIPSPIVSLQDTEEIKTLRSQNLYEDHVIEIRQDGDMGDIHVNAIRAKLKEMLNDKSINYGVNGLPGRVFQNDPDSIEHQGTLIHLVNSLPYPKKGTPLDDLLEFRYRREDSLKSLMININEMETRVNSSPTPGDELKKTILDIDKSIQDLVKQYKEKGIKLDFSGLKVGFNKNFLQVAMGAYKQASTILPLTESLIAATAAGISSFISWDNIIRINTVDKFHPMTYAFDVKKTFNC